jgi:hypothetical protein
VVECLPEGDLRAAFWRLLLGEVDVGGADEASDALWIAREIGMSSLWPMAKMQQAH